MNFLRIALIVLTVLSSLAVSVPTEARADSTRLTRAQIRALPLMQRPNRPGHFIGNTIRNRAARR